MNLYGTDVRKPMVRNLSIFLSAIPPIYAESTLIQIVMWFLAMV